MERVPLTERILRQSVPDENGCRIWTGPLSKHGGYGKIKVNGKQTTAQRAAYEAFVGEIPAGYTVDHTCNVHPCVEPDHLEAVTLAENIRRQRARITHCPQGHLYAEHAYRYGGRTYCRRCRTEYQARRRAALVNYP